MQLETNVTDPVMNCSAFKRRSGNNAKFIRGHIDTFQAVYPRQLQDVRLAAKRQDPEKVRVAARALKGTVGTFAAEPALSAVAMLEEKGSRGDLSGIDECYRVAEFELERLYSTLMSFDMGGGH